MLIGYPSFLIRVKGNADELIDDNIYPDGSSHNPNSGMTQVPVIAAIRWIPGCNAFDLRQAQQNSSSLSALLDLLDGSPTNLSPQHYDEFRH